MSTVEEIEAVLPGLTMQELRRLEMLLHRARRILASTDVKPRLTAFERLQKSLALDKEKALAWQEEVSNARR